MKTGRALGSLLGRRLLSGVAAAVVIVAITLVGLLEPLELGTLGLLFEARGPRPPTAPIVIVTIDEDSFNELNRAWPFPRALHGRLLERLAAAGVRAIGVDLFFPEPSLYGAADDEALGAAVARAGNVVLAAAPAFVTEAFYTKQVLNLPVPVIRRGAAAVGAVDAVQDPDSGIRRASLGVLVADELVPSFDRQLYQVVTSRGLVAAPLPAARRILINYRGGPNSYPWFPYHRVVGGELPPEVFRDKIVLVGATSPVLHDVFATPFARAGNMPGVEIHANILETLLRGNRLREAPEWLSTAVAAVAAVLGGLLVVRLRALRALGAAVLVWLVLAAGVVLGFAYADVWMRGLAASLGLVLGYGATVVESFVREQREKRRLSQFFSPAVVREIVRHRDDMSLGSSRKTLTVLFSDIRGFTSISERLEPEQVAEMLREYLTEMTEIVFRHGGTVDKYIGDCIMALYNVPFEDPEHAVQAIRTGLDLQERTLAVSARWEERFGVRIRNGVGINTGEAVVGTLGSRQRLEYTAIGDAVNLASRLESITKDYNSSIIISESTYELVRDHFRIRQLGEVPVKGKARLVKIYGVLATDLRRHPRATLEGVARIVATAGERAVEVTTIDVGEGGMGLSGVPGEWPLGAALEIRCEAPDLSKPLTAAATIAWRKGDVVGVVFTDLHPDAGPTIADHVGRQRRS